MKRAGKYASLLLMVSIILSFEACEDWGQMDPPAGNQVYPKLELKGDYKFDKELSPDEITLFAYDGGEVPLGVTDDFKGKVLQLDGGYARLNNPLYNVKVQAGVSITMWVKTVADNLDGAIFSFSNEDNSHRLFFTPNAWLRYDSIGNSFEANNPQKVVTGALAPDKWHYVALSIKNDGYFIYIDGEKKFEEVNTQSNGSYNFSGIVKSLTEVPYLYLGYGSSVQPNKMWVDDLKIYRNIITAKEIAVPTITEENTSKPLPEPVYFNSFERGVGESSIQGSGSLKDVGGNFGIVFQNKGGAKRTNYLLLPSDALSHSASTKELSIAVWVSAKNAGQSASYMWTPLFTAYGAAPTGGSNTMPMFACQYRGVLQVNCSGWCDFTDAQNTEGKNTLYHGDTDWLSDGEWHLYTATFTETSAKVYFDGELKNEWKLDGTSDGQIVKGLFSNGADLKYICLGGNQAWDWGDDDNAFMYDDIAIYNKVLTAEQIKTVINSKNLPTPIYFNSFERGVGESSIQGSGSLKDVGGNFGIVFQNKGGAKRTNYLLLPSDALSHSASTKELSIAVWVSAKNAGQSASYMWTPLFTAYGAAPTGGSNTMPMFACQYRGVLQVNCSGWCDFTDAQNTEGKNTLYHGDTDWLSDGEWHLYTATFTETSAKVYFDGELKNEWKLDGTSDGQIVKGLFSNGADLKYICLGGNQAWDWGDDDNAFMYDGLSIYNKALTIEQIKVLVHQK